MLSKIIEYPRPVKSITLLTKNPRSLAAGINAILKNDDFEIIILYTD